MKTEYKHIHFEKDDGGKTYYCKSNQSKSIIGIVSFYPPWKRYVFEGREFCVFDAFCLADIIDFLKNCKGGG